MFRFVLAAGIVFASISVAAAQGRDGENDQFRHRAVALPLPDASTAESRNEFVETPWGQLEISLAVESGRVIPNQMLYIPGDQGSTSGRGVRMLPDASTARQYFIPYASGVPFGVLMRPDLNEVEQRTYREPRMLAVVLDYLRNVHGFTSFQFVAQSGAFTVAHDLAEQREDVGCLIGASGVGNELLFFKATNPQTSALWADRFLQPDKGVGNLPQNIRVGVVHHRSDEVVPFASIEAYVAAAARAGRVVQTDFRPSTSDDRHHNTLGAAVSMFRQACDMRYASGG